MAVCSLRIIPLLYAATLSIWANAAYADVADQSGKSLNLALQKAIGTSTRTEPAATTVVQLGPGDYRLQSPWTIDGRPAGDRRIEIRGASDGSTQILGSIVLSPWRRVSGNAQTGDIEQFPLDGRLRAALKTAGIVDGADPSRIVLFQAYRRLTPARWPEFDYARANVLPSISSGRVKFAAPSETRAALAGSAGAWIGGYFRTDYAFSRHVLSGFDTATGTAEFLQESSSPPAKQGFRFFLYNVATALRPGHFIVDWAAGRLTVAPYDTQTGLELAVAPALVVVANGNDIQFEHIQFRGSAGAGLRMMGSTNIALTESFIGQTGTDGIEVNGGYSNRIDRCVITDTGASAVVMSGGNRQTLEPGRHALTNSIIEQFSQTVRTTGAVVVSGAGQSVEGNLIADGPFSAIVFSGNEHRFEGNEISHVLTEVSDFGAIYSGRDWTARGDRILRNYLHDIAPRSGSTINGGAFETKGIYLDDLLSGEEVHGNVFDRVMQPVFVNGGRDNIVEDNVFIDPASAAITVTDWGLSGRMRLDDPASPLRRALAAVPYSGPVYAKSYPSLANILNDNPGAPEGNAIVGNVMAGKPILHISKGAIAYQTVLRNEETDTSAQTTPAAFLAQLQGQGRAALVQDILFAQLDRVRALQGLPYAYLAQQAPEDARH